MKVLIVADIHGKFEVLQKIMDAVADQEFDLVVGPGDFTDMFDIPPNFSQLDVADIVIQKLLIPRKPLLCIPGNHDPYEIIDVFEDYGTNLHDKKMKVADITFAGWGGAVTPFNTLFEPAEEETKDALEDITKNIKGDWVLVVHSPPKGTGLDTVKGGKHVGSGAVRDTIIAKKPLLVISAHIHEHSKTDRVGSSTVFYPGPAFDGYYGIAEIREGKVACKIKKVGP